ncbi:MAG: serine/threonine protein kinase [Deltaproteobacteria bacterium]|nr:serine/threonine protein kinase [Deltaproteobacteria bacterium]
MADRTGEVIDSKYKLVRLLGEGGMGAVYEAQHLIMNRRCAVKFLHSEIAANTEAVGRFIREAQAAAAIRHKGIVEVYDVGTAADGLPYLVMEFLEGASLGAYLADGRKLPLKDVIGVVVQALSALAPAHRRGIIHRDIKPDNIFIIPGDEGGPVAKVLDFGISKVNAANNPQDRMTRTGTVLGTPYYMAPEQAAGKSDIDARADLYSMGVILYEALTGRLPFEGENYNQLILSIFTETPPRPREIVPDLPEAVEAVILKAMAREKQDRFADAAEMIRALVALLDDEGKTQYNLPLRNTAAVERLSRTPVGAVAGYSPTTPPAHVGPATAMRTSGGEAPPRSNRGLVIGVTAGVGVVAVAAVLFFVLRDSGESPPAAAPPPAPPPVAAVDAGPPPVAPPVELAAPPAPDAAAAKVEPPPPLPPDLPTMQAPASDESVVHIAFAELPADAVVVWDGARVPQTPFVVKKGEAGVILEVRAAGFRPFRQFVVPSEDRTFTLERAPEHTAGTGRPPGPGAADARSSPPGADASVAVVPPPPPPAADAGADGTRIRTGFPGGSTGRDAGGAAAPADAGSETRIRTSFP